MSGWLASPYLLLAGIYCFIIEYLVILKFRSEMEEGRSKNNSLLLLMGDEVYEIVSIINSKKTMVHIELLLNC